MEGGTAIKRILIMLFVAYAWTPLAGQDLLKEHAPML